ncbi:MAG: YwiC-like family protein [Propionibacteriaceae bacterium]|nr:YwiC-like family protein [Propionibacteriaceae bacterium]
MTQAWIPRQHGVWAMMIAPALAGGILAGFSWPQAGILVAWVSAYLAFMAVRGWLRPRRHERYVVPTIVYAVVCVACVAALLVWRPGLLWWGVPLAAVLGASLVLILTGHERTVVNDALLIGASCLMAVVTATCRHLTGMGWASVWSAVCQPRAWVVAAVYAGYFWGTILYVKTMIRRRGQTGWWVASVAYHAMLIVPALLVDAWVALFAVVAVARAAVVPRAWPRAKPLWIGVGEICLSILLTVVVCCTAPL